MRVTFINDLEPYTYLPETVPEGVRVVAVGWLDGEHDFREGELCKDDDARSPVTVDADGAELRLGSAEVRVVGRDGVVLAAPDLVYHYVGVHRYRPPDEFVDAVLAGRAA